MRESGYSLHQPAFGLRQADEDRPVPKVCRKTGISEHTFYCSFVGAQGAPGHGGGVNAPAVGPGGAEPRTEAAGARSWP